MEKFVIEISKDGSGWEEYKTFWRREEFNAWEKDAMLTYPDMRRETKFPAGIVGWEFVLSRRSGRYPWYKVYEGPSKIF